METRTRLSPAILALAFRPFFLFGPLYGVLAILYWAGYQLSWNGLPPYFEGTLWHAHEMLFGFVASILAGFLLTASKNWAKTRGVHGRELIGLILTWLGAILAGTASLLRLAGWKPLSTVGRPILWVLHLGYAFLSLGLIARGLSLTLFPVKSSIPLHLITAGAMGMLILGMISRVSLGHTGRPLVVSKLIVTAYWLVVIGALVRVLVPLFFPPVYIAGMAGAALIWAAGLVLFAIVYWPILARPRIDGLEG